MAWQAEITDGVAGSVKAQVDANNQLRVLTNTDPLKAGATRVYGVVDEGTVTGSAVLESPEVTSELRQRVSVDTLLESETFNYAAQNTAKHAYANTTMTNTWASGFLNTNGSGITTLSTGTSFRTYNVFPLYGAADTYVDMNATLSAAMPTNTTIDFGLFYPGAANPYAPTDGVFFRFNNSGLQGVMNINGVETTTGVLSFTPTANTVYRFTLSINERRVRFWINDVLYATLVTPIASGQSMFGGSAPLAVRHAIGGSAASGVVSFKLSDYTVSLAAYHTSRQYGHQRAADGGMGYQGQSGFAALGSTANYANSANPTAAVPTNTTAALGTGLGGQFWETDTLAVTTDGIICSYQVPAGSPTATGRKLVITGVWLDSYIQTVLTGGGYVAQYALAFGHTNVSLATAEAAAAKAPRRIALGVQTVAAAAAALTLLNPIRARFDCGPVVVNPGEFVALVKKKVGTAPSAGVVAHIVGFDAHWE